MKGYRSYMDRIKVSAGFHQRLLEGGKPERRGGPVRAAAAAACCALLLAGGFWGFRLSLGYAGRGVEPVAAATPATPEPVLAEARTPPPEGISAAGDWGDTLAPYVLRVEDPFQGRPHGDFFLPGIEIPQLSLEGALAADYGYSPNFTETCLTPEELVHVLGGTDTVPWSLYWAGFELLGTAHFDTDTQETLREVFIYGEREGGAGEQTTLRLTLTPGQLPPADVVYVGETEQDYAETGVPVKACFLQTDDGLYHYRAEFMAWGTGARLEVAGPDQEEAASLILYFLRKTIWFKTPFNVEGLSIQPEHIRIESRTLTQEDAYAAALGDYLPRYIPAQFRFGTATGGESRKGTPIRKTLTAGWDWGYAYISVYVQQFSGDGAPRFSDRHPHLAAGTVTAETLEAAGEYVDSDAGDIPAWRYYFVVEYPAGDGENTVYAQYSIKGLTPQQAENVVNSCDASMCAGVPLPPTPAVE